MVISPPSFLTPAELHAEPPFCSYQSLATWKAFPNTTSDVSISRPSQYLVLHGCSVADTTNQSRYFPSTDPRCGTPAGSLYQTIRTIFRERKPHVLFLPETVISLRAEVESYSALPTACPKLVVCLHILMPQEMCGWTNLAFLLTGMRLGKSRHLSNVKQKRKVRNTNRLAQDHKTGKKGNKMM